MGGAIWLVIYCHPSAAEREYRCVLSVCTEVQDGKMDTINFSHMVFLYQKKSHKTFSSFLKPSKRRDHESKKQQPGWVLPVVAMVNSICTSSYQ